MKKITILTILVVGFLVLSGVGMTGVTSSLTLSSQKQLEIQKSENNEKLEFVYLRVHVNEIYGTVDDPRYRPLANVTVEIKGSLFGIYWEFVWGGLTKESGKTDDVLIANGLLYKVIVSKDGYHTYRCSSSKIVKTTNLFLYSVNFTMAEDGSPFTKQISQSKQQSNYQGSQVGSVPVALDEPTPPDQPTSGPGGSDYSHAGVKKSKYKSGVAQYWIFEPTDPTPTTAPLIVFLHGWCGIFPFPYIVWIEHIVKHGNIVVYPIYQRNIFGYRQFTLNAITEVKHAIQELQQGNHVRPDLDKFAIVGDSLGGGVTANMAALAQTEGLPTPKAIMPVQPVYPNVNLSLIPNTTLMVVVVGANDTFVGTNPGKSIFYEADQIPFDRKDFVIQVTDRYGFPDLVADHAAPLCIPGFFSFTVDAMDYYSTWKLFDALTDYAFYGINGEYCLGNTSEQRFMGLWSDGTPVKELIVTDNPIDGTSFNQQYNQQNLSSQQTSNQFFFKII